MENGNKDKAFFIINKTCFYFPFPCVYREEATPSSIPNLAVKLLFADDTAPWCGNVGRCRDRENIFFLPLFLDFLFFYNVKMRMKLLLSRW